MRVHVVWLVFAALLLTSCQRYEERPSAPKRARAAQTAPQAAKPSPKGAQSPTASPLRERERKEAATKAKAKAKAGPTPLYSSVHDAEIKEILKLAGKGQWEEAETRANAMIARDPQDASAERLVNWVKTQREKRREQALEDKIREIDAQNSVFNPSLKDLATEKKDRGLPARKDVRDAVEQIQATPYVPETYGKTNRLKGMLFDLESPQGHMAKLLEKEVSIHLDNAPLETIIFTLGQAEGISFVADRALPALKLPLVLNLAKVKMSEFLRYVSRNLDVQFQVGDDLVWIVDSKDTNKVQLETKFYRLRKGFILPAQLGPPEVVRTAATVNNVTTVTESQKMAKFVNDLAPTLPGIENAMKMFFTGKYQIDYERNIILARGTREQLETLDKIVEEFDKPIQQVLIEARFITISEAAFLKLGVAWETGRDLLTASSLNPTDYTGLGVGEIGLGLQETKGNILSRKNLSATLTALQQSGESQTLSAPRLTVVNNLPATINNGKVQYYYEEYQVKQTILDQRSDSSLLPSGKPVKLTAGIELSVLASIGGDGRTIFLALNPRVNQDVQLVPFATVTDRDSSGKVVSTFDIKLPQYSTQELSTRVVVRSGETVVMGGILERTQSTFVESVPILGNIPILGAAFRRRTELDKPRYLLIFVTATLLADSGEFIIYDDADTKAEKK